MVPVLVACDQEAPVACLAVHAVGQRGFELAWRVPKLVGPRAPESIHPDIALHDVQPWRSVLNVACFARQRA